MPSGRDQDFESGSLQRRVRNEPYRARTALASTWAIHQAREVVNTLYHSAGATAIFDDHSFEWRFRDMHTASQQAQGRQAHYETIGRILFGLPPDTAMFAF